MITSTSTHREMVIDAARGGKALFCEKPISLSLEEAEQMLQVVENTGVFFQMAFQRRFDAGYVAAKKKPVFVSLRVVVRLAPAHYDERVVAAKQMVVRLRIILAVIHRVSHLVFVPGDNQLGVYAASHPLDVGRPAVGHEHVHTVLVADVRDPVEVAARPLGTRLVPRMDHREAVRRR
jgi:hypothetical protein